MLSSPSLLVKTPGCAAMAIDAESKEAGPFSGRKLFVCSMTAGIPPRTPPGHPLWHRPMLGISAREGPFIPLKPNEIDLQKPGDHCFDPAANPMPFQSPQAAYSFSFTTGALFVPETLAIARQFREIRDWKQVAAATRSENLLRQRTEASTARLLREIRPRLEQLSPTELDFLVGADPRDQRLLLFIAVCRRYRFIREFTIEVLWPKIQASETQVYPGDLVRFIEDRGIHAPEVEKLTDKSRAKVRQVILRILSEAGLMDSTDSRKLQRPVPSRSLAKLLMENDSKQLRCLLLSEQEIRQIIH